MRSAPLRELAVVATAYLAVLALVFRGIPTDASAVWGGSIDQARYLASARAFAELDLSAARHWYPFGFSLALVPFVFLPSGVSYLLLNLVCLLAAWWGFRAIAARFEIGAPLALALFVVTTIAHPGIAVEWIRPWTTTLSACLMLLAIARTLAFGERHDRTAALVLGVLLAAIVATRPADAIVAAMLGLYALGAVRARPARIVPVFVGGGLVSAGYLALHLAVYGLAPSDYMKISGAFGFNFAQLGWKAYLILIEPRPWYPSGPGLLKVCPWLPLGAAGMVAALLPGAARRREAALLAVVCAVYAALMLAYVDLLPMGLWAFGNVHYFKWLLPLFGMFAILFLRIAWRRPAPASAILLGLILVTAIRIVPQPVGETRPARAILFPAVVEGVGGAPVPPGDIYFARSVIRDRVGDLRNFFEYHQVARPDGRVVAIALWRDFAGKESWQDEAVTAAGWPRGMPGEGNRTALPGAWPRPAQRRYAPRLVVGLPCWLPLYRCPSVLP